MNFAHSGELEEVYYGANHPMKPPRLCMAHHLVLGYDLHKHLEVYVRTQPALKCSFVRELSVRPTSVGYLSSLPAAGLKLWHFSSRALHCNAACVCDLEVCSEDLGRPVIGFLQLTI